MPLEAIQLDESQAEAVGPAVLEEHGPRIPYTMDLTGPSLGPGGPDSVDVAVVAAVAKHTGTRALWRSWRYPARRSEWPLAKRAYLVKVASGCEGASLAATAARLQGGLVDIGERDPLVGVFADEEMLPAYHRHALRFSALLWTAQPRPTIHMARDCAAIAVGPDLPLVDTPEGAQVLAYLAAGTPLRITRCIPRSFPRPSARTASGSGATPPRTTSISTSLLRTPRSWRTSGTGDISALRSM